MSTRQLLLDSAERMFTDHSDKRLLDEAEAGEFPESLLKLVRDNGLHEIALPDSGVGLDDVFAVLEVAGRFALPLPIAEMVLGGRWLRDGSNSYRSASPRPVVPARCPGAGGRIV